MFFFVSLGVWGIVNNAGWSTFGEVEWVPMDVYEKVASINLFGTMRVTKAFLPLIRVAKGKKSHKLRTLLDGSLYYIVEKLQEFISGTGGGKYARNLF